MPGLLGLITDVDRPIGFVAEGAPGHPAWRVGSERFEGLVSAGMHARIAADPTSSGSAIATKAATHLTTTPRRRRYKIAIQTDSKLQAERGTICDIYARCDTTPASLTWVSGEIAFDRVGRDRRIPFTELVKFEQRRQRDRRELAERFAHQQQTRSAAIDELSDLL
jgi:hypothetical protein